MNKKEFLEFLRKKLRRFKKLDVDEIITYYDEIILDTMQSENFSEEQAVVSLGKPENIIKDVAGDMIANKKTNGINGALILIGIFSSPVLLPITIVIITMYLVVFAVWLVLIVSFAYGSLASLVWGIYAIFLYKDIGLIMLSVGLGLIAFIALGFFTVIITKYGWKLLNFITVSFATKLKRRKKA